MLNDDDGYIYSPKLKTLFTHSMGRKRPGNQPTLDKIRKEYPDAEYDSGMRIKYKIKKVTILTFDQNGISGINVQESRAMQDKLDQWLRTLSSVVSPIKIVSRMVKARFLSD